MNPAVYILCFLFLFTILINNNRNRNFLKQIIFKKNLKEVDEMKTLAQRFIDKECLIYTFNSQVSGVIKEIGDSGLLIENNNSNEIINFDYIIRIREYPKNKKGKKKGLILD